MPDVQIQIQGNLTADPELRFLPSGRAVAQFSVASTPRKKNTQSGEWEDGETVFLRVSVWQELAEGAAEALVRGDSVTVTGKLRQRSFEKDGQKRTVFEVDGDTVGKNVRLRKQGGNSQAAASDGPGW